MPPACRTSSLRGSPPREATLRFKPGFTLIELLVVIGATGILAAMVLLSVGQGKQRAQRIVCVNNLRELGYAWIQYSYDHEDRLVRNGGGDRAKLALVSRNESNWANNVMSWELDSDNTNLAFAARSPFSSYLSGSASLYRCPSDKALSDVQRSAGWRQRVRSYSMNGMVGDAGESMQSGRNVNNPDYVQFVTYTSIPDPSSIFVFVEEHPDSINDGYFLNNPDSGEWIDLPASTHEGAGVVSFADGHIEVHPWKDAETRRPSVPDGAGLPMAVSAARHEDFEWLARRTSVEAHQSE